MSDPQNIPEQRAAALQVLVDLGATNIRWNAGYRSFTLTFPLVGSNPESGVDGYKLDSGKIDKVMKAVELVACADNGDKMRVRGKHTRTGYEITVLGVGSEASRLGDALHKEGHLKFDGWSEFVKRSEKSRSRS
jgi:hypothetical protein